MHLSSHFCLVPHIVARSWRLFFWQGSVFSCTQCLTSSKLRMNDIKKDVSFEALGPFTAVFPLLDAMCWTCPFLISTGSVLNGMYVPRCLSNWMTVARTSVCTSAVCPASFSRINIQNLLAEHVVKTKLARVCWQLELVSQNVTNSDRLFCRSAVEHEERRLIMNETSPSV